MICPCGNETQRTDGFCSWSCAKKYAPPKEKKYSSGSRARKQRIREMVKEYTDEDWQKALAYFDNKCAYCGSTEDLEQEHFVPVRFGGGYTKDNIVPSCKDCNSHKQGQDPFKWLVVKERKLREYIKIEDYFNSL